jgi:hypothetical protein
MDGVSLFDMNYYSSNDMADSWRTVRKNTIQNGTAYGALHELISTAFSKGPCVSAVRTGVTP